MKATTVLSGFMALLPFARAFSNPVLYEDLADVDLRRYNDTYYYSASTMHFSPGAPILRSYDLANWEYIGHSVPQLADFGSKYTLSNGERAYIRGVWASWLIYVPANGKWYWGGCTDFWNTHVYASSGSDPAGPWSRIFTVSAKCQYDSGAMLDDDGYVYTSYKDNGQFWIAQWSQDLTSIIKTQVVYTPLSNMTSIEGTRPYKINGTYYIFTSFPDAGAEYVLKADGDIWSTYTPKVFLQNAVPASPLTGSIGQGALVDTPQGNWYWMGFSWSYPNGRIPVLIPVNWGSDGYPIPSLVDGKINATYPNVATPRPLAPTTGIDKFTGSTLGVHWEWNHDPDTTKFSVGSGLKLSTATITNDLYAARNTLTRRQLGPISTATIKLAYSSMADGDRVGLAMFRESSAYIGIWKSGATYSLNYVNNLLLADTSDNGWQTTSNGTTVQSQTISGGTVWLRITSDSTPGGNNAKFYYSLNGRSFTLFGPTFTATTSWQFFEGCRYAIFNFATSALGGSVTVNSFDIKAGA
ncbi:glycosyl hydrolase [Auriculariales sp. MPI-PUGE-AT-0066]|nr:glycosyl hydrolase [Auriculariales sp. MPI-PUGE-AT-0066]